METVQNNENGNNFYAKKNINIKNYYYENSENKKPDPKALTHLPRSIETFVGREGELNQITESFKTSNTLLLVNGVGGIGKSTVAKEFLNANLSLFDYKIWINYKDSLISSIISDLNPRFKLKGEEVEIYKIIIQELNNLSGNNLMIIDNFDNSLDEDKDEVKEILPNFKILITSRDRIDDIKEIRIEELSESKAIELFEKHYKSPYDKEELKELLKQIGYHSLLIELIAKALNKSQINTIDSIKNKFKEKRLEEIKTKINFRKKSDLIIEHIKALFNLNDLPQSQILILKQFAILPSVEIEFKDLVEIFGIKEENLEEFDSDLNELISKGWINKTNHSFKIHQLIIEFINLENKPAYEEVKEVVQYYIDKLAEAYRINPINGFKYISFAKSVLETLLEKNEKIATLANNLSTIYQDLGDLKSALEFAKKDIEISEKTLDKNHPSLATSYSNLSTIYYNLGDLKSALEFAKKSLEIRENILDKNHPSLATSYNNLSTIYQDLGDLKSALEFAKKALEIRENILDKNHPDLAISYNNLSTIYQDLGDLKSALEFAKKANEIYEKVLDKNHPLLATSYNNLSMIYQDLGDLKSALEFAKKALEIKENILDKNHPSLATSYNNLSMIYFDLKEYDKAVEYMKKAIKILESIFPNGHPNLDGARGNLGVIESVAKR